MNDPIAGAQLLAVALVVLPSSPQRRLVAPRRRPIPVVGTRWFVGVIGCAAVGAAATLPLTTLLAGAVLSATVLLRYRRRRNEAARQRSDLDRPSKRARKPHWSHPSQRDRTSLASVMVN